MRGFALFLSMMLAAANGLIVVEVIRCSSVREYARRAEQRKTAVGKQIFFVESFRGPEENRVLREEMERFGDVQRLAKTKKIGEPTTLRIMKRVVEVMRDSPPDVVVFRRSNVVLQMKSVIRQLEVESGTSRFPIFGGKLAVARGQKHYSRDLFVLSFDLLKEMSQKIHVEWDDEVAGELGRLLLDGRSLLKQVPIMYKSG